MPHAHAKNIKKLFFGEGVLHDNMDPASYNGATFLSTSLDMNHLRVPMEVCVCVIHRGVQVQKVSYAALGSLDMNHRLTFTEIRETLRNVTWASWLGFKEGPPQKAVLSLTLLGPPHCSVTGSPHKQPLAQLPSEGHLWSLWQAMEPGNGEWIRGGGGERDAAHDGRLII